MKEIFKLISEICVYKGDFAGLYCTRPRNSRLYCRMKNCPVIKDIRKIVKKKD